MSPLLQPSAPPADAAAMDTARADLLTAFRDLRWEFNAIRSAANKLIDRADTGVAAVDLAEGRVREILAAALAPRDDDAPPTVAVLRPGPPAPINGGIGLKLAEGTTPGRAGEALDRMFDESEAVTGQRVMLDLCEFGKVPRFMCHCQACKLLGSDEPIKIGVGVMADA
jgi:hypothetical protein